ncbi:hypothetical protein BKA62DRAFT_610313 [Auriculariales sp. MPI-PUGE-AT-0066]|nr:hypothetical protein BKA62DRAFT_610313 [Auriculariales sp. MPI-PUGE-AT-0066]
MPPYPSNNRAVKSAFDVLKDSSDKRPTALPRLQPVTLSTPALVQRHTPCTMHLNILPPELACQLFYAMVQESRSWTTNKWWLFDKLVESPHKTSFWIRLLMHTKDRDPGDFSYEEASKMWYNGRKVETPKAFLSVMEEACDIIEKVVSEQLAPRQRYPLEWGGDCVGGQLWRANVAASNCYTGRNESVGFHSDQLTYLGPYTTIASLSLGTTRTFRLRETIPKEEAQSRAAQTFNIPLLHNSLTIMHATCQEYFKHSIPPQAALDLFRPPFPPEDGSPWEPSNIRINLTFRFYRPDFHPSTIPRCKCDVPMILRPDMKGRPAQGEEARREIKYWWTCYASAQTEGKGCELWQLFNAKAEGRGPFVDDA